KWPGIRNNELPKKGSELSGHRTSWPFEIWLDQPRIEFVLIPEGKLLIGSKEPHTVVFEKPFYLAKYALTRKQYAQLAGKNPSHFKTKSCPVESVSWDDSVAFCEKLSQQSGVHFGLPSEAQWEYACRAGSTGLWCFGSKESQLPRYAWYDKNSGGKTHPVGKKEPNDWSLYDMHGNVWEWCEDAWHDSYKGVPSDGSAWKDGADEKDARVLRGGSWRHDTSRCRAFFRSRNARARVELLRLSDFAPRLVALCSFTLLRSARSPLSGGARDFF
ncbi:MAG: formylglycine-generating enzyme family protein, partial [Planctomycetota bacterium]|nr:formylglycine-generating enzyme family protein [Planctomycetota bacterium]